MKRSGTFWARVLLVSFWWALAGLAGAQQEFSGKTVVSVSYQPAKQPIDPRDLQKMQIVQPGEPLNPAQVATSIDNLFASGFYDDIQVTASAEADGVAVTFVTRARQFIGHVDVVGKLSDPPSKGVIMSDAQLYLGTPYNPADVDVARENILDIMRNNGLYQGDVGTATITDRESNEVTIRFLVNAGKRAHYSMPVIKGDPKLPTATIVRATGWRIPLIHWWRQVTEAETDRGTEQIEKKYTKKNRLTATVSVDSMAYDAAKRRLTPTLDINSGPVIQIKALEAKLPKKKIQGLVPVYQEGSVDRDLLTEGAQNITNYFEARGYPDVEVTFKQQPEKNDLEEIDYYISLGPRRRLVHIDLLGSRYFDEDTLQERMFLQTKSLLLRYGRYSETFRHSDEATIENLYRAIGFRDVKVTSAVQADYKGKENDLGVTFHIYEGALWTVSKLDITGSERLDVAPIRDQLYSIEGQPFADVNVASDRNRILTYYYEHGFLHASFQFKAEAGAEPNTVHLIYTIHEGRQEFIRGVILSGLNVTKPALVQKLIKLNDGDPISMAKINDISRQITDLGIFSTVNNGVQDPDGQAQHKYVLYDFDEAARYTFNVGFGLEVGQFGGTTSNLNNSGGAKGASPIVSFDVSRLNFRGIGQTISLQTRYSSLEQRESLNYIVPRLFGSESRTVTFSLLYDTTQDVQSFSARREQASVQTSQRFNRASTLLARFDYRRSTANVELPALLVPALVAPVRIGIASLSYIQDHRDNPADAHRGFWNTADVGVAGNFFGGQRNFLRTLLRNATYTPLGRNLVLARQTEIGGIVPFNVTPGLSSFEYIPLTERFYGGGSVSMRGFADNQAGPRDIGTASEQGTQGNYATGFPIGGNALFFNSVELRFPLLGPNISGVFFEDMGNIFTGVRDISFAYRQPSITNFNYSVQAAGFGIRYKTPLGPLRVDLSYALNPPQYKGFSASEPVYNLLNCSPTTPTAACTPTQQRLTKFNFFFSIGQAF